MGSSSRSLLLMLAMAAAGLSQTQAPPDEKPATVEGEVRDVFRGTPVERAHVSLRRYVNGAWDRYGAQTTVDGKFAIAGVAAGSYQVTLDRVGYVASIEITRSQLTLRPGEKKDDYKLKVIPVGSISGRVLDADGAPLEGLVVEAEFAAGVERTAVTDDRGQYRIGGLHPGKYRVRAKVVSNIPTPPEIRTDGSAEINYAPTYHPAGVDAKSATAILVAPATDATGVDVRMVRVPVVRFAGRVSGVPAGVKPVSVQLQMNGARGSIGSQAKADGSFEIWRLSPGKYTATAFATHAGDLLRSAPVDFEIGESDVENIELRVLPPEDVKGRLEFDDEMAKPQGPPPTAAAARQAIAQQPQRTQQMRRITVRDSGMMGQSKTADIAEDGSFTLEKVSTGRYVASVSGYPAFVKSVRLGQTSEDGPAFDFRYGANGAALTVTLSSSYGTIGGVVKDDKGPCQGARVVVRDTGNRNFTNGTISASDGTYTIKNLPPGNYKLLVLDEGETNLMTSEANLDDFDDRAETIELRPKETLARDLKLRAAPGR